MNTYNLVVDSKVSLWHREYVIVEAETLEEAIQRCMDNDYVDVYDMEDFYDTVEMLSPDDVNGPTLEIYKFDDTYSPIYTNKPVSK
jgi:hypothetical protein